MVMTKAQILIKNSNIKELGFEEITTKEEIAIEEGRKAYVNGDWKTLNQLKYELGSTNNRTRKKKS